MTVAAEEPDDHGLQWRQLPPVTLMLAPKYAAAVTSHC